MPEKEYNLALEILKFVIFISVFLLLVFVFLALIEYFTENILSIDTSSHYWFLLFCTIGIGAAYGIFFSISYYRGEYDKKNSYSLRFADYIYHPNSILGYFALRNSNFLIKLMKTKKSKGKLFYSIFLGMTEGFILSFFLSLIVFFIKGILKL